MTEATTRPSKRRRPPRRWEATILRLWPEGSWLTINEVGELLSLNDHKVVEFDSDYGPTPAVADGNLLVAAVLRDCHRVGWLIASRDTTPKRYARTPSGKAAVSLGETIRRG